MGVRMSILHAIAAAVKPDAACCERRSCAVQLPRDHREGRCCDQMLSYLLICVLRMLLLRMVCECKEQ